MRCHPVAFRNSKSSSPVPTPKREQQVSLRKTEGSSQKENTVGDILKSSSLFQTQQAEISWSRFQTLALFLFLICLGYKVKHKKVFSLRSMDLQILIAKKETNVQSRLAPPPKGKGTVHRIRHFRKESALRAPVSW